MIKEYDHVKIKSNGITGIVVDISEKTGCVIVESDKIGVPGGWGEDDSWKLFDCIEPDLEKLNEQSETEETAKRIADILNR